MAKHPRLHFGLSTVMAVAALVLSGISLVFTWKTYDRSNESLGFIARSTYECPLEFQKADSDGILSLCWFVTITNRSETRTSIIEYQAFDVSNGQPVYRSGFPVIENEKGGRITTPIVLDGGDARTYLMRVPFSVPSEVASLAETLPQVATLHQLQSVALKSNLDVIGNKVSVRIYDPQEERQAIISWPSDMRVDLGEIRLWTGRGSMFSTQMSFPPIFHVD